MTDKDANKTDDNGSEQKPDANDVSSVPVSEQTDSATTSNQIDGDDELPEYEELTPEIVEEEAIRGDFMLRWASIFLAVLFGFSQISDTRTLVHIRSGEQLQASGFIPSGTDSFSYANDGQAAPNVSWLFDHVVNLAYSLGGENGLTIFKALVAGIVAYCLSIISIAGMPTWWSSICCVLAICAASIDFMPITDLATLLGLALVLLLLHSHHQGSGKGILWKLPVIVAVWANLDSRAYIGVIAILLFSIGLSFRKKLAEKSGNATGADTGVIWKALGICVVALAINPAPVASLTSVVSTYSAEYPGMAAMNPLTGSSAFVDGATEYYPIWQPGVLKSFEFAYLLGIAIVVVAFVVLLISRDRDDLPWLATLIGFTILACLTVRELPLAALIAAATAGTGAQRWYARTFRQEYTVETMEVLFSRGGRAVTVLAMAFLGFCIVADRLPTRTAVGLGFDPDLKTTIDTLEQEFAELPEGTRVFPTKLSQGDLLIWHGMQTFIDSRAAQFGAYSDDTSVVKRFDRLRRSLLVTGSVEAATDDQETEEGQESNDEEESLVMADWQPVYRDLGIDRIMIRLCPPGAVNYTMTNSFLANENWVMTNRGSSAAFFELSKQPTNEFSPSDIAFGDTVEKDVERFDFARPKDFYQNYLYRERMTVSSALRDAQHHLILDSQVPPQASFNLATALAQDPKNEKTMRIIGRLLAGPLMTIRSANDALALEPQNAVAHRLLGEGYRLLNQTESALAAAFGAADLNNIRYLQAVMALRQSTIIEPDYPGTWRRLADMYQQNQKTGLALECIERYLALEEEQLIADPEADEMLMAMYKDREAWKERRALIEDELGTFLEQDEPETDEQKAQQKSQIIRELFSQGHTLVALELAEANSDLLTGNPQAELLKGEMLLETGQLEDGYSVLNRLEAVARENKDKPEFAGLPWHNMVALSNLAKGAYPAAVEAWGAQVATLRDVENTTPPLTQRMLQSMPLIPNVEGRAAAGYGKWPLLHLESVKAPMDTIPSARAETIMLTAMANMEAGNLANARFALKELVTETGDHKYGILSEIYFSQLSDDASTMLADARLNPWEDFEFPETDAADSTPNKEPETEPQPEQNPEPDAVKADSEDAAGDKAKPAAKESSVDKDETDAAATEAKVEPPAKESDKTDQLNSP